MSSLQRQTSFTTVNDVPEERRTTFKSIMTKLMSMCQNADFYIICVIIISLLPVLFILTVVVPKVMADDGITTIKEMMDTLNDAMETCETHLLQDLPPTNDNGNYYTTYCKGEWDKITCWPHSPPGQSVSVQCPEYIVDFDHAGTAQRLCGQDGTWASVRNSNQTWTDYSGCKYPEEEDIVEAIRNGDPKTKSLIILYTVGYSFSLAALIIAMIILAYFNGQPYYPFIRSSMLAWRLAVMASEASLLVVQRVQQARKLHCTRNYIHMNLFASFILRALVIFLKDRVLYHGAGILDVRTQGGDGSLESLQHQLEQEFPVDGGSYNIGCKLVITLFHYFVATNYYWILVEALYLHSLIFVAFFSDKHYLWKFTLTGWGVPVLFVVPWAIVRATLDNTACWDIAVSEYKWIYNGPIVVANVINFLLFLNIVRVLWYKMRERGTLRRSDNGRQYKKLAKSTLVLIPMFGVHAIVFIGMPDNITSGTWWDIRMNFDLFFNSFQGFFVAIIYCFCNGEVQAEFRKAWDRFNLSVEIQKDRRSRSSVTMMTSFNSSASQQARLSIGGQSNGRNGHQKSNGTSILLASNHSTGDNKHRFSYTKSEAAWNKPEETTFITKQSDNLNNNGGGNLQVEEEEAPLINCRPSFIRTQSSSLPVGSDVILPIAEEKDLEEAFENAVEEQISCPAGSFNLVNKPVDKSSHPDDSANYDVSEKLDEFDDVISGDETNRLRQKRMLKSRRAESEDSGISSASTFFTTLRGRERHPSTSNSDYLGDSEGVVCDDVRNSSDAEGFFDKRQSEVKTRCEKNSVKSSQNIALFDEIKEVTV